MKLVEAVENKQTRLANASGRHHPLAKLVAAPSSSLPLRTRPLTTATSASIHQTSSTFVWALNCLPVLPQPT